MHPTLCLLAFLTGFTPILAAPTTSATPQAIDSTQVKSTCGQYTPIYSGGYTVNPNKWGEDNGSGSQCAQIDSISGNSLAWSTTWSWANNEDDVKSYANAELTNWNCKELSNYKSIPSKWNWDISGSNLRADISYDTFLSSSCSGAHQIEVMIWFGAYGGIEPIGAPNAISTPQIGPTHFKLYKGYSSDADTTTYSFVSDNRVDSFNGDLLPFFNYLVSNQGVSAGLFLQEVHAGIEAEVGQGVKFTTHGFSLSSN